MADETSMKATFHCVMVNREGQKIEMRQVAPIVADYGRSVVVDMPGLAVSCREQLGQQWFLEEAHPLPIWDSPPGTIVRLDVSSIDSARAAPTLLSESESLTVLIEAMRTSAQDTLAALTRAGYCLARK